MDFSRSIGNGNSLISIPEAEKLLERQRDDLIGKELWKEFPELINSPFELNYRRVMTEQVPVEFEACDGAGKVWFEVHAYPSGGGVSVFFRDTTERKRNEEERLTTSKLESLGTLAGGIAHDLNNILTVISGNIGLAQIEAPNDAGSLLSFLSKAGQAAQHAAHLSSQLLTFSKGGAPLKRVASISELLGQAAEFSLYGSNLRADIDIPVDLWKAEVDPGQIEQVVNALMINAREAMPHGGTVRISARNVELEEKAGAPVPPGRYIKIRIADRGEGIAEDLATKIFDPYFTTKPTGSGLGLSISYSIVKKHGGMLHLENSSPEGSTFAFYLPATDRDLAAPQPQVGERVFNFNHQKVLVMDDEAAIRDLTSQLLGTLGYEVTAVPDGLEAVKSLRTRLAPRRKFSGRHSRRHHPRRNGRPGHDGAAAQRRSKRQRHHLQRLFGRSGAIAISRLRISQRAAKAIHAARAGRCAATRIRSGQAKLGSTTAGASAARSALAQLFQLGDERLRSARHIAEFAHLFSFAIEHDDGGKALDSIAVPRVPHSVFSFRG